MTPLLRLYAHLRRRQLARQDPPRCSAEVLLAGAPGRRHAVRTRPRLCPNPQCPRLPGSSAAAPLRGFLVRAYWQPAFPTLVDVTLAGADAVFRGNLGHHNRRDQVHPGQPRHAALEPARRARRAGPPSRHRPASRVFGGRNLLVGGSTALVNARARGAQRRFERHRRGDVPGWARRFAYPPPDIARLTDWTEKMAPARRARTRGGYPQHFGNAELAVAVFRRIGAPPSRARDPARRFLSAARTDRSWRGQFRAVSAAFRGMARRRPCRIARGLCGQRGVCRRRRSRSRRGHARRARSRHFLRVRAGRRDRLRRRRRGMRSARSKPGSSTPRRSAPAPGCGASFSAIRCALSAATRRACW